jgi:hypothetical protein
MPEVKNTKGYHEKEQRNTKGQNFKKFQNMEYLDILDNYMEYPSKNIKFSTDQHSKIKFLSENDKASGWNQLYRNSKKSSKFLQTNLHYLPESVWPRLKEFTDKTSNSVVGYKTSEQNINYFVHKADTDDVTRELFNEINLNTLSISKGNLTDKSKENIIKLNSFLIEKGIESWLTIRATKVLEGSEAYNQFFTNYITGFE